MPFAVFKQSLRFLDFFPEKHRGMGKLGASKLFSAVAELLTSFQLCCLRHASQRGNKHVFFPLERFLSVAAVV